MSISYQPKQAQVQAVQLKVQQLVLTSADTEVLSGTGTTTLTVNFGQAVESVRACLHIDDSAAALIVRNAAQIVFNGAPTPPAITPVVNSIATITLSAAFEAGKDALIIDFVAVE
jgi:hypothetical protein